MKFGLACDHAGFQLKERIKRYLSDKHFEIKDFGCFSDERVDYPDYAHALGKAIEEQSVDYGIAICGSGNGISMSLNKHQKVRAALAWTPEIAQLAKAHNDANVLSLPARFISEEEALKIVDAFLSHSFDGGRHEVRVRKIPCIS